MGISSSYGINAANSRGYVYLLQKETMVVKIFLCITLIIISLQVSLANDNVIKLDDYEVVEFDSLIYKDTYSIINSDLQSTKMKKPSLGTLESNLGPIKTKLQYKPFNQSAQVEANMDLIESYQFFKDNHDLRMLIPYTNRGIQRRASEIKHIKSKIHNGSIQVYQEFKKNEPNEVQP